MTQDEGLSLELLAELKSQKALKLADHPAA